MKKSKRVVSYAIAAVCGVATLGILQMNTAAKPVFAEGRVQIDDVTPTSSAAVLPKLPASTKSAAAPTPAALDMPDTQADALPSVPEAPAPTRELAALSDDLMVAPTAPVTETTPETALSDPAPNCDITLSAEPKPQALVTLSLDAPCLQNAPFVIHHSGMMFNDITADDGTWSLDVPALTRSALFIAAFDSGDGAVGQTFVTGFDTIQRVAVQWRGAHGLQLHAREFDAAYFGPGHVWHDAPGYTDEMAAGYLLQLGDPTLPGASIVEVYTFPMDAAPADGTVALTIEAEVNTSNCAQLIEAEAIQTTADGEPRVQEIALTLPDCDAAGEFLVLNNVLEDLTIAAN